MKKVEFVKHGFTQCCQGCMAIISGTAAREHTEACCVRMEKAMEETDEGRERKRKQDEKEKRWLADKIRKVEEVKGVRRPAS